MNSIGILGLGLLLGLRHATDADHVIAVTTIVSAQKKLSHAALVGITWGIGHTIMILIMGILIFFFHLSIPEQLQLIFELAVAIILILLGVLNLTGVLSMLMARMTSTDTQHAHLHLHGHPHTHEHIYKTPTINQEVFSPSLSSFIKAHGVFHLIRPLVVGIVHGLAGSATVTLLILSSITNDQVAIMYLAIFGLGTILGMMGVTTLISLPVVFSLSKVKHIDRIFTYIASVVSILYGLYYGYTIGITKGLFFM